MAIHDLRASASSLQDTGTYPTYDPALPEATDSSEAQVGFAFIPASCILPISVPLFSYWTIAKM